MTTTDLDCAARVLDAARFKLDLFPSLGVVEEITQAIKVHGPRLLAYASALERENAELRRLVVEREAV